MTEKSDFSRLLYQFIDFHKISNLFVFTCAKLLFSSKGFKNNFGSYYNIALIVVIVILSIYFYSKGYHSFQDKIKNIINQKFPEEYDENGTNVELDIHISYPSSKLDIQNPYTSSEVNNQINNIS